MIIRSFMYLKKKKKKEEEEEEGEEEVSNPKLIYIHHIDILIFYTHSFEVVVLRSPYLCGIKHSHPY